MIVAFIIILISFFPVTDVSSSLNQTSYQVHYTFISRWIMIVVMIKSEKLTKLPDQFIEAPFSALGIFMSQRTSVDASSYDDDDQYDSDDEPFTSPALGLAFIYVVYNAHVTIVLLVV
jgi:hypothetical protein